MTCMLTQSQQRQKEEQTEKMCSSGNSAEEILGTSVAENYSGILEKDQAPDNSWYSQGTHRECTERAK